MKRRAFIKRAGLFIPFAPAILHAQILPSARHAVAMLPAAAPAGPSYLLEENWEDASPDGWTISGAADSDTSTTGLSLEGSQCLYVNGTASTPSVTSPPMAVNGTVEVYFMFRPKTLPGADRAVLRFLLGETVVGRIEINEAGKLNITVGGTASNRTVAGMSLDTTYHVWARYSKGTGADGFGSVAFSSDGTRPTSGDYYTQRTTMNGTSDVDVLRFLALFSTTGPEYYTDKLRASASAIGNNPE